MTYKATITLEQLNELLLLINEELLIVPENYTTSLEKHILAQQRDKYLKILYSMHKKTTYYIDYKITTEEADLLLSRFASKSNHVLKLLSIGLFYERKRLLI